MSITAYEILFLLGVGTMAFGLGGRVGSSVGRADSRRRQGEVVELQRRLDASRRAVEELTQRHEHAEKTVSGLQRSIVDMPEIAQRLAAARDLREIPDRTLELVDEIFDPVYSVFYRAVKEELVAVACSGASEYRVGHRLRAGEGIVGWTATKQVCFTPEDAKFESAMVKSRNLASNVPEKGFSLCLPILTGQRTIGVILIGPSRRSMPHLSEIGRTIALIASVTITSAVVLQQQRDLAKTDGLTGLLNKTHTLGRIRDLITSEEARAHRHSLFLFDIDHFKHYNDTNGHLPGDELLKDLSALLRETSREGEIISRYGGEEFLLVMPGVGKREALRAAERIRGVITAHAFAFGSKQPLGCVTVSGGVATWPADSDDVEGLIRCADEALYVSKREGRNRVTAFASPELAFGGALDAEGGSGELELTVPVEEKE